MGLPGLRTHRKFRRLVAQLRIPEAHALGHLQMMWETSWDHLSPALGDATDVELAAGWVGDHGALAAALVACGGDQEPGFLEADERGRFEIHDWLEHAPRWVKEKIRKRGELAAEGRTIEDVKREAGKAGAAARWKDHTPKNGKPARVCHEKDGKPMADDGKSCPSPPLPSLPIDEPNGSSTPKAPRLEDLVDLWNGTLAPLGYGKCTKLTTKRRDAFRARLKGDPDFPETFAKAVGYLATDGWWKAKARQFTIDLLLEQANRAQELSEKTPSTPTPTNGANHAPRTPAHRAEVDAAYLQQLDQRPAREFESAADLPLWEDPAHP